MSGDACDARIDKRRLRASFSRAAEAYDRVAVLQREVGDRLLDRLQWIRLEPAQVLDLGCGTGYIAQALLRRYRGARVVGLDIAEGMLHAARRQSGWWRRPRFVCGDVERLPLTDACADLVISNLTLQWCNDLEPTFAEFLRVLRPGGALLFTTFGPDTLHELRASWAAADGCSHVNRFLDMHDVGDMLLRAGLADPVLDVERFTLTYPDLRDFLVELKTLGAHNATDGRARSLTGPARWRVVRETYETFRREGALPATYEVIYGHAWKPDLSSRKSETAGETRVPLTRLRRRPWEREG